VLPEVGASADSWGTKVNSNFIDIDALFDSSDRLLTTKGGTGLATYTAAGAMLYSTAATVLTALAIGSAGKILRSTGTAPAWSTLTIPDTAAAGDLLYGSASNVLSALAKGTARQLMQMNSGATAPEWTSNLDIPGTLDVTGAAVLDSTLTVAGAASLNGAVALGNAAADAITVPGTIGSNLIFTDNTYDIGAAGATRPRDLHLGRNAVVAGTLGVTGKVTLGGEIEIDGALNHDGVSVGFFGTTPTSAGDITGDLSNIVDPIAGELISTLIAALTRLGLATDLST
jgi:hypothetical protein